MNNECEYYLIERDSDYQSPLLMNDDDINSGGTMFLLRKERVDENTPIHLVFNPPVPPKPAMTDYLWLSGGKVVFSKKIYDVLKEIEIKNFQLVPAVIKTPKGDYLYVSICLDKRNFGKIFYGSEPEYEESILIADSLEDFFTNYIDALNGIFSQEEYKQLI